MKKVLYGTTALVAASMVTVGAASAAERIKIKVGGYYQSLFAVTDQNKLSGTKYRQTAVEQEGEIHFKGETTLDNGLTVGVQVQLENRSVGDQIDEHYVYLEGGWGRFVIGAENSAAYLTGNWAPTAVVGHGVDSPNFSRHVFIGGARSSTAITRTSDANKVTYYTPRFGGLQLGASYTPEASRRGGHGRNFGVVTAGTQLENVFEAGMNFSQTWDEVSLTVTAGYLTGESPTGGGTPDPDDWRAGAEIGFGGFTVGASYNEHDGLAAGDINTFSVGATYGTGPWTVGAGYLQSDVEKVRDDYEVWEVGGKYALGPGVTVSAGLQHHQSRDATRKSTSTTGALILGLGF